MPPHPDSAARTHRPRGPSGAARGSEALFHPENHRVFRTILPRSSLRVDGKREETYDTVVQHMRALVRKRFQTLRHDDYGNVVREPWEKEIRYFMETVLSPRIMRL